MEGQIMVSGTWRGGGEVCRFGGGWSEMTQTMQSTAPREDGDEGGSVPVLGLILNSGRFMPVLAFSDRWTEVGYACPEFMGKAFRLSGL